jgi:dihydrofolate synthase/folylpolyglutamate synthase
MLMHSKSYETEIEWLFHQFPSYQKIGSKAYKPTLENIQSITKSIDSPEKQLQFMHVAGSNGKGSICSMVSSILTEAGYKVGLFTSPHIADFSERIRVNGEVISQDSIVNFIHIIKQHPFDFSPSFFEVTFAMALNHFKESKCDICIIETGLGGRLDASNIITPLFSVITNISLEHTDILGDTIEKIAIEKAGIIKREKPVLLGEMTELAAKEILTIAKQQNSPIVQLKERNLEMYTLPLLGEHQKENFKLVLNCVEQLQESNFHISEEMIVLGLKNLTSNTGFSGRIQLMESNPTLIFDVSHNYDGISKTLETVRGINNGILHIVFGTSKDKNITKIPELIQQNDKLYLTEFKSERSMHISDLKEVMESVKYNDNRYFIDSLEALKQAKSSAKNEDVILVIGSFFLVAEFF